MPQPEVVSHVVFPRENQVRVIVSMDGNITRGNGVPRGSAPFEEGMGIKFYP